MSISSRIASRMLASWTGEMYKHGFTKNDIERAIGGAFIAFQNNSDTMQMAEKLATDKPFDAADLAKIVKDIESNGGPLTDYEKKSLARLQKMVGERVQVVVVENEQGDCMCPGCQAERLSAKMQSMAEEKARAKNAEPGTPDPSTPWGEPPH